MSEVAQLQDADDFLKSVVVLTPIILSLPQSQVPVKGLNFVPSASFNLFQTINTFVRLFKVKHFLMIVIVYMPLVLIMLM